MSDTGDDQNEKKTGAEAPNPRDNFVHPGPTNEIAK
jgi:hypothetical protein